MVRTVSSGTHVGFHVTWNGIERMGVSSSSGWSRLRWSRGQSIVYMFAELFGSEMRGVPFVSAVDYLVDELFVPIYFDGV